MATALGAVNKQANSNECQLNGEPITIKCAQQRNDRVGVYGAVLGRVVGVLGAFETDTKNFYDVYRLSTAQFRKNMIVKYAGKPNEQGQVIKSVFEWEGVKIASSVEIDEMD